MGRRSDFVKRGHEVFLTRIDEAAFSRALIEAFPDLEFWDRGVGRNPVDQRISALHMGKTLHVDAKLPRPGWTPELGAADEEGYWRYPPVKAIWIHRSIWHWRTRRDAPSVWHPPILTGGRISSSYRKDDRFGLDFVETMWRRILPKVAVYFRNCTWAGHDALRWASESPDRKIDAWLRPPEGWSFDKLKPAKRKYYEGLEAMRPESDPQPPPEMNG